MTHQGNPDQGQSGTPRSQRGWGQSSFLIASCAVVGTAAYLGSEWLRAPLAGLPTGVWGIIVAQGAAYAWSRREYRMASERASLRAAPALPSRRLDLGDIDVRLLVGRASAAAIDRWSSFSDKHPAGRFTLPNADRLAGSLSRLPWPSAPIRVGLDVGPDCAAALATSPTAFPVEWVPIPASGDEQGLIRRFRLDALVRHDISHAMRIATPDRPGREATWLDWGTPRPLCFPSVFPTLLDPAQITLDSVNPSDRAEARALNSLIVAAAVLSRSPHRLTLTDHIRGRRPTLGVSTGPRAAATLWPAEDALLHLAAIVETESREGSDSAVWKAAARIASAFLAATDAPIDAESRRRTLDACARALPEEPDVLLRAAAMRFASWDDQAAFDALARADRAIRAGADGHNLDQLPFLQSELEHGLPGPFTLGRVAAGICLACATSPLERFPHIRGDCLDDMRYSAWLVGRDQDRALLTEVFRMLERDRAGGSDEGSQAQTPDLSTPLTRAA